MLCLRKGWLGAARRRGARDGRAPCAVRGAGTVLAAIAFVTVATSCTDAPRPVQPSHARLAAQTHLPASATSVLAGAANVVAGSLAERLFASAPVVVVAGPGQSAELAAARSAQRAHAPLLLASARPGQAEAAGATGKAVRAVQAGPGRSSGPAGVVTALLRAQIKALDPRAVLAVGMAGNVQAARLPGIHVVTDPAMLPATKAPSPLGRLALLVRPGDGDPATLAAVTTARVAGARVIAVRGADPRADPDAIAALSAARPRQVIAIGAGFGPAGPLAELKEFVQSAVAGGGRAHPVEDWHVRGGGPADQCLRVNDAVDR